MVNKKPPWRGSKEYLDAVLRHYAMVLIKNPTSLIFVSMANTAFKSGKLGLAEEVTNRGLKHHPHLPSALILKARVLLAGGRLDEAEKIVARVISKDPRNFLARKVMAEICLKKGKPANGLEHLEVVRETIPKKNLHQRLFELLTATKLLEAGGFDPVEAAQRLENGDTNLKIISILEKWLNNIGKMIGKEKSL